MFIATARLRHPWSGTLHRESRLCIWKLSGKRIDAAFVVLDDRLEETYAEGMAWFLSVCRPAYVLPMHFWNDRSVVERFLAKPGVCGPETRILNTARETHWELQTGEAARERCE